MMAVLLSESLYMCWHSAALYLAPVTLRALTHRLARTHFHQYFRDHFQIPWLVLVFRAGGRAVYKVYFNSTRYVPLRCLTVCNCCDQVEDELDEISNQEFEQFEKTQKKDKWNLVNF